MSTIRHVHRQEHTAHQGDAVIRDNKFRCVRHLYANSLTLDDAHRQQCPSHPLCTVIDLAICQRALKADDLRAIRVFF